MEHFITILNLIEFYKEQLNQLVVLFIFLIVLILNRRVGRLEGLKGIRDLLNEKKILKKRAKAKKQ